MNAIEEKLRSAGGAQYTELELNQLRQSLPMPQQLVDLLAGLPLVGARLSMPEHADRSGLGVEMQWLTANQMISEAKDAYPGILAAPRGYLPIGMCLEGSGDYYYYRGEDGAVVRIPHESVRGGFLDESQIELVADSVRSLLESATSEPEPGSV